MNQDQMLSEMCQELLSNADVKAICKNRGFTDKEANSRALFENFFLTTTGIEAVMNTLTAAEVATLHLLRMENREVDVTFFERLYGSGVHGYGGTFTQQYKPIFDSVQTQLVRRGILIIADAKTNSPNKTKMELWRYRFPAEFGPLLPSLFTASVHTDQPGSIGKDRFRDELRAVIDRLTLPKDIPRITKLANGTLYIGGKEFSAKSVQDWQESRWESDIVRANLKPSAIQIYEQPTVFRGYMLPGGEYRNPTPLPFVRYALSQLEPDEWIAPDQLDTLLDIFYGGTKRATSAQLCQMGYEYGCLAHYVANDKIFYRLPDARHIPLDVPPDNYLGADANSIDLDKIPYRDLEILNRSTALEAPDGQIKVAPDLNKLMDAPESVRNSEVLHYL